MPNFRDPLADSRAVGDGASSPRLRAKLGEMVEPGVGPGADESDTDRLGSHGATW
jgi:hypothetical protein